MYIFFYINNTAKGNTSLMLNKLLLYFNLEDFDLTFTETGINSELHKVKIWLKLNKLSLNANKTKLMVTYRKQK